MAKITHRGRTFVGTILSAKAPQTATVEWERKRFVPKYERFETRRSRVKAHNPTEINAVHGDKVRIAECRPLSKTKRFIIIEKLGKDIELLEKEQSMDVAKHERKEASAEAAKEE